MSPKPIQFCEHICRLASKHRLGLRLDKTATGFSWEWAGVSMGDTTAHTKPVALLHACEDLAASIWYTIHRHG